MASSLALSGGLPTQPLVGKHPAGCAVASGSCPGQGSTNLGFIWTAGPPQQQHPSRRVLPPHAGIGAGVAPAPAARRQLFDKIGGAPEGTAFTVKAQFLEIYNEELRDLLGGLDQQGSADQQQPLTSSSPQHSPGPACSGSPSQQRSIVIRECPDGQITVNGENLLLHE